MALYSKFCIMCDKEFRTMRISSVFCSKRCGNRSRSLPVKLKESLIQRNTKFTMVEDNRPNHRIQDENALLMSLAKEEARKRGIRLPDTFGNTLDYINKSDPANGDSTGFGRHDNNTPDYPKEEKQETQNDRDSNNTDSSNNTKISIKTGIRKIGGLK